MTIDNELLDHLTAQAKVTPRLRQNYDFRSISADKSQRMLNPLEIGTILTIHHHTKSSETLVTVRGKHHKDFCRDNVEVIESIILGAGGEAPILQVPAGENDIYILVIKTKE